MLAHRGRDGSRFARGDADAIIDPASASFASVVIMDAIKASD
jgi:hypothetical protein